MARSPFVPSHFLARTYDASIASHAVQHGFQSVVKIGLVSIERINGQVSLCPSHFLSRAYDASICSYGDEADFHHRLEIHAGPREMQWRHHMPALGNARDKGRPGH
jgi:hypothetical protein